MTERHFSPMDRLLSRVDSALRTLTPGSARAERQPPGLDQARDEGPLSDGERRHVTGLMRINHTGEVCAQGLYQGQASTATLPHVRHAMEEAAREEEDHLAWCEDRIREQERRDGRPAVPIVALTAHILREHRERSLASGMNAHIPKPVEMSVLRETLVRFTGRPAEPADPA